MALNRIINIDLHIHSAASAYKEPPGLVAQSGIEQSEVLLAKLIENGIDLFSITDHNRFDCQLYNHLYELLETNRAYERLSLLPGVEFDVEFEDGKKAAHVVAIFDAKNEEDRARIAAAIDDDKLVEAGDAYDISRFESLLKKIGLSTMLIAHQHSGFGGSQKKRSIGAAASDAIELYKFGYIDALEYRNPNVQGILRSELNDLGLPARAVVGSDCHDWSVYPKHDASSADPAIFYATARALPTFRGLHMALTSPETRFSPIEQEMKPSYLKRITMCDEEIPMSPGINVIIGENGIGKSSVLTLIRDGAKVPRWMKKVKDEYAFGCDALALSDVTSVEQGVLQSKYQSGSLFAEELFGTVSNTEFETKVTAFVDSLKSRIKWNINAMRHLQAASQCSFVVNPAMEGETFLFTVSCPEGFTEVDNPWETPHAKLRDISSGIEVEVQRAGTYDQSDVEKLAQAKALIDEVRDKIGKRAEAVLTEASVKGIISNAFAAYTETVELRSKDADIRKKDYREDRSRFISIVLQLAKDACDKAPGVNKIVMSNNAGISERPSQGFKFVRRAKYAGLEDLSSEFVSRFNTSYRDIDKLTSINSPDAIANAIPGTVPVNQWEAKLDELKRKFIDDMESTEETIMDVDSRKTGNTLGEMSLAYYRYMTSAQSSATVFVADQPEDNISNRRISARLTEYFDKLRRRSQVIIVTHNPLLVVNQDADNVIVMRRDGNGQPSVCFGCLESEDHGIVLEQIAEIMDGGKDAVKRRMKAYGTID